MENAKSTTILNDFICFHALCHTVIMAINIHSILYTAALGLARSDFKRTNYKIEAKINIKSLAEGKKMQWYSSQMFSSIFHYQAHFVSGVRLMFENN